MTILPLLLVSEVICIETKDIKHTLRTMELIVDKGSEAEKKHPLYNIGGVYGIYVNDELAYIGESNNLIERWMSHTRKVLPKKDSKDKECNTAKYRYLRLQHKRGKTIEFRVLELRDKNLKQRETQLIIELNPPLNVVVARDKKGKIIKKKFEVDWNT